MDVVEALKAVESEARMPTMLKPPAKLPSLDRYSEDQAKQKPKAETVADSSIWGLTGAFARRSPVELSPALKALKGAQGSVSPSLKSATSSRRTASDGFTSGALAH